MTFRDFQPVYKGTVAESLNKAIEVMLQSNHRLKCKWLVALYFSACGEQSAVKGIQFRFLQLANKSMVDIGGKRIPIQDIYEGSLLKILFSGYTVDEYTFAVGNYRQLVNAVQWMKRYIIPFIQFNGEFGVHSIKQLRLYALVHDYGLEKDVAARVCGVKLSIFGEESIKKMNEKLDRAKAVKLSPSVI